MLGGCGALADRESAAATVAAGFERALRGGDSTAACAGLAPATRRELERSSGTSCPRAITAQQLTPTTEIRNVDVYGRQARVVFWTDTVFLSQFSAGWKVTAAGCNARTGHPYDCEIRSG